MDSDDDFVMADISNKRNKSTAILIVLMVIVASIMHQAQASVLKELQSDNYDQFFNKRFIPEAVFSKSFSGGFDRLIADIYWLIFIQYYGDSRCRDDHFRHAPDYIELVVHMDPHFIRPYWFASFVLSEDLKQVERADDILREGIKNNPNDWSIPYIAGFNQYLYADNPKKAAYYYRIAGKVPGAPSWLNAQARILELDIPSYLKKVRTWLRILKQGDAMVKGKALQNLTILWSKMYWAAPTDIMRKNIKEKLEQYQLPLLPKEKVPSESLIINDIE